jgi:hypothetical protein
MRKKYLIISLASVVALAVIFLGAIALSPSVPVPSALFAGYTNDASGGHRALFVLTNSSPQTFNLQQGLCIVGAKQTEQRCVSSVGFGALALRLGPGQAATVTLPCPPSAFGVWRGSFEFLPARAPVSYRLKIALHRAGLRSMGMTLPTVSAVSEMIDL